MPHRQINAIEAHLVGAIASRDQQHVAELTAKLEVTKQDYEEGKKKMR